MKLRAKGQLTIPAEIRAHLGLHEGDDVEFEIHDNVVHLTRSQESRTHGRRIASRLRGRGSSGMSTEEIMDLLRGED
jgi:AbrB family looped-hinge helix DNA binding protein